jgi:hypothetical protein
MRLVCVRCLLEDASTEQAKASSIQEKQKGVIGASEQTSQPAHLLHSYDVAAKRFDQRLNRFCVLWCGLIDLRHVWLSHVTR